MAKKSFEENARDAELTIGYLAVKLAEEDTDAIHRALSAVDTLLDLSNPTTDEDDRSMVVNYWLLAAAESQLEIARLRAELESKN